MRVINKNPKPHDVAPRFVDTDAPINCAAAQRRAGTRVCCPGASCILLIHCTPPHLLVEHIDHEALCAGKQARACKLLHNPKTLPNCVDIKCNHSEKHQKK